MSAATLQAWSAEDYGRHARFVADLAADLVDWLAPQPGERILDLGCGDGVLTRALAETGATVVGVDASEAMVAAARAHGVDARLADATALPFAAEFDAVFSNATLHWVLDPRAAIAAIHRALRPGGRLVAEFGGHGNVAAITTALRAVAARRGIDPTLACPWIFPTADAYRALLEEGGFRVDGIVLRPRPTRIPGAMADWLRTFRAPFFAAAGADAAAEVEALLAPALRDDAGQWTADYVRLRVKAVRP